MTPAERAIVAQATADEWTRLAALTDFVPVKETCKLKARNAQSAANYWEGRDHG